jgi:hypothetical protein
LRLDTVRVCATASESKQKAGARYKVFMMRNDPNSPVQERRMAEGRKNAFHLKAARSHAGDAFRQAVSALPILTRLDLRLVDFEDYLPEPGADDWSALRYGDV